MTRSATKSGGAIGYDKAAILERVLLLSPADFYKTMPSDNFPERSQDVYQPRVDGLNLDVKLPVVSQRSGTAQTVVISFKENDKP